jgi:hypothetical protein
MTKHDKITDFMNRNGITSLSADGEEFFSHRQCECCETNLSGMRYECRAYSSTTGGILHFESICVDCYYTAEYGDMTD